MPGSDADINALKAELQSLRQKYAALEETCALLRAGSTAAAGVPETAPEAATEAVRPQSPRERYARLLLANSRDLILVLDADLAIMLHTANAAPLLGLPLETPLGGTNVRELEQTIRLGESESLSARCLEAMTWQQPLSFEDVIRHEDGREFYLHTQLIPLPAEDAAAGASASGSGVSQGVIVVRSDISDLAEERRKAQEAVRAKSSFLATMSHEIRTPMNSIIGMAYLALATELSPQQHEYVQKIYQSSRSLLALVNDILDFTRLESGRADISHTDFILDDLIPVLTQTFSDIVEHKPLDFFIRIDPALPRCLNGDMSRLSQALEHLVENAVKFTPAGEVFVEFTGERQGDTLLLHASVRDTGIGMDEEQISRLFMAFSQGDASNSRKYGGTGLGLALVERRLALMNGLVSVTSSPGQGSCFTITCPLRLQSMDESTLKAPDAMVGARILLADPSLHGRPILRELLESWGFSTLSANSAKEALERLENLQTRERKVDLVILSSAIEDAAFLATAQQRAQVEGRDFPPILLLKYPHSIQEPASSDRPCYFAELPLPVLPVQFLNTILDSFPDGGHTEVGYFCEVEKRPGGVSALLVETDEENRRIAVDLLNMSGVAVTVADDGLDALFRMDSSQKKPAFDMVFLALDMPGMNGWELARMIRRSSRYVGVRLIAMAEREDAAERARVQAAGMDGYLAKPLNLAELFMLVGQGMAQGAASFSGEDSLFTQAAASDTDAPPVDQAFMDQLHQLKREIEDFDAVALDTFAALSSQLTKMDAGRAAVLERALELYEFEEALRTLVEFLKHPAHS